MYCRILIIGTLVFTGLLIFPNQTALGLGLIVVIGSTVFFSMWKISGGAR